MPDSDTILIPVLEAPMRLIDNERVAPQFKHYLAAALRAHTRGDHFSAQGFASMMVGFTDGLAFALRHPELAAKIVSDVEQDKQNQLDHGATIDDFEMPSDRDARLDALASANVFNKDEYFGEIVEVDAPRGMN